MQGVAKLVEEGLYLVKVRRTSSPGRGRSEVENVNDNGFLPQEIVLVNDAIHPGATPLCRACKVIGEQQRNPLPRFRIRHFPHIRIRGVAH